MARSNSFNYSLNRNQVIQAAYIEAGLKSEQETLTSAEVNRGSNILNWMIKAWSANNVQLWKRKQATLFTSYNTNSYLISLSGSHCTNTYNKTTITTAAASGQTTLSISSNSGINNGDYVGIKLDDNTRHWTTVVSTTSTSVTITTATTASVSVGNTVITYTSKINRPLRIIRGTSFDLLSNNESKLCLVSHDRYFDIPLKTLVGTVNNIYYDKQLDSGVLYVYPTPNNVDQVIKFSYHELLMDMDSATDDFDFPQEWVWPIILNLAVELARSKGNAEKVQALEPMATSILEQLKCFDSDMEPLKIKIKRRR